MPAQPTVTVNVQDQGTSAALTVPSRSVQAKIGCAVGAAVVVNQPVASSSPVALQNALIGGPLAEASGLVAAVGNVAIALAAPIVTMGTASAVTATTPGGSTSVVTVSLDGTNGAWDTYYVKVLVTKGTNAINVAGAYVQISLDAGRNYGTPIALNGASSLVVGAPYSPPTIGGTGITLSFAGGTLVAGDYFTFSTVGPQWNGAGVAAALAALQASQYGVAGVGSIHIVGDAMHGGSGVSDIATIQAQLQTGVGIFQFDRAIVELRDAKVPTTYGGTGETEATWIAALQASTAGLTVEPRICANGGNYNMPSCYQNPAGGQPSYRRNLAWAQAVRRTQIPLERRAGRVKDGPLANIVVSPATDGSDGFVYHNDLTTPGLGTSRIACAQTWPGKGAGFFMSQEPLLCAPGSQFVELAIGNVLDAACDIGYAAGVEEISDDLLLQPNGTLDPVALNVFQGTIQNALTVGLTQPSYVSSVTATVSPTANVQATGIVPLTIVVQPKALVNSVAETISLATP